MIDAIIQALIQDAGVQQIVGMNKSDDKVKVYPVVAAQPEKNPYIVVRLASKEPVQCKGKRPSDFMATFEVHSVAKTYKRAEELDYAAELAISNQSFTFAGDVKNTKIQNVVYQNSRDGFYEYSDGVLYSRVTTYTAMIHEAPIAT